MKILVLNGPNLNLLGRREPHIYGSLTLADITKKLEQLARELGVELAFCQSNHEGELVDFLHNNIDSAAGALLNPAGLTQFGVSLHDARWRAVYGVDDERRVSSSGQTVIVDFRAVAGHDNLAQAVVMRLLTPRGELTPLGHPDYGSRLH